MAGALLSRLMEGDEGQEGTLADGGGTCIRLPWDPLLVEGLRLRRAAWVPRVATALPQTRGEGAAEWRPPALGFRVTLVPEPGDSPEPSRAASRSSRELQTSCAVGWICGEHRSWRDLSSWC